MSGERGKVLVLIHGWGFSGAVWDPVAEALAGGPALCVPDLPGHGRCPDGERLADVREAARAILDQLPPGVREPVWAGWSLGGLVALAAAEQWNGPQRLALVCATPRFTALPDWSCALAPEAVSEFAAELERDRGALQRRFTALCTRGARDPSALRRVLQAGFAAHPARIEGLRAGLTALARSDLRDTWTELDAPVSAWLAADDALVPVGAARYLAARRPDARLGVVPGGHASWLEAPSALAGFLREVMA
jgi:pimeloyl-[acyl-carrier protein] methyl ester esterase